MSDNDVAYLTAYIQKLESSYLDVLRRSIDADLKISGMLSAFNQSDQKYTESQKQVALQNEMMQQAADTIKSLTETREIQDRELERKQSFIIEKDKDIGDLNSKVSRLIDENSGLNKKIADLQNEINRQNGEMAALIDKAPKKTR